MATTHERGGTYEIRSFRPDDREPYLDLYERVFGERREAYFDWRFVDNPYVASPPIQVATTDDELVGGRSSLVLPMSVGRKRVLTIVQVDPMVHPDHRGQGLFSRMVESVYDQYASTDVGISIGFPSDAVRSALERMAERLSITAGVVDAFPQYYRIQRPTALVGDDEKAVRGLAKLAAPVAGGYLGARDRLAERVADHDVVVERYDDPPVTLLSDLAGPGDPDGIHAVRDEEFYRWRFDNPRYEYVTYVARNETEPVASLVAGTRTDGSRTVTHVSDVLPLGGVDRRSTGVRSNGADRSTSTEHERAVDRTAELARLLGRLVDDHRGADLIAAAGRALPTDVLSAYGFHDDTRPPLDRFTDANYFIARPVADERVTDWQIGRVKPGNPEAWLLSFCDREIG